MKNRAGRLGAGGAVAIAAAVIGAWPALADSGPYATTGPAENIYGAAATGTATLFDADQPSTWYFEYQYQGGADGHIYAMQSTPLALPATNDPAQVTQPLADIASQQSYEYRVVLQTPSGEVDGQWVAFSTPNVPPPGPPLPGGRTTPPPPSSPGQSGATTPPPAKTLAPTLHCVIPRLAGITLGKAEQSLVGHHCRAGRVIARNSRAGERHRVVVSTYPGADHVGKAGTRVTLRVVWT